jgi:tetratricopeptide (TPR) repeat protein
MLRPSLALTMIVKDEARCLARCLQSALPLVDEMVICDTGSTDETAEIARRFGATVVHLPWPKHFAQARNHGLDHARSDWNLIMDADEWVDSELDLRALRQFIEEDAQRVGLVRVRSSFMIDNRTEFSDSWLPRLLPRHIRFQGRIHEQPVHQGLRCVRTDLTLHHDGYEPSRARSKAARNFELLKAELMSDPHNAYLHYQMGVQHDGASEWEQASQAYLRALSCGASRYPFAHSLSVRLLHALCRAQRHAEALAWAKEIEQQWPQSSDVFFAIGNLCLDLAITEPAHALDSWLPSAQAAWLRCLEIGEEVTEEDEHVVGRGSHLAAYNLGVVQNSLKRVLHHARS